MKYLMLAFAALSAVQGFATERDRPPYRYDALKFHVGTTICRAKTQTVEQVRLMKECGIDFVCWFNGVDRRMLDLCLENGIQSSIQHQLPGWTGGDGRNAGKMRQMCPLETYTARAAEFEDHPGIAAFFIADEPSAADFDYLAEVRTHVEKLYPGVMGEICLYPSYALPSRNPTPNDVNKRLGTVTYREYVEKYVRKIPSPVIFYDVYPWAWNVTRKQFFDNLKTVSDVAHQYGRDVHVELHATRFAENGITNKCISANMMRLQMFSAMAYGAIGVSMNCWYRGWWIEQPISLDGKPTPTYYRLKSAVADVRALAGEYMKFRNERTVAEQAEDGAALLVGEMVARDESGVSGRFYVAVDDVEDEDPATHTVLFKVPKGRHVQVFGTKGPLAFERRGEENIAFKLTSNQAAMVTVK